jgi:hypothetical protein
VIRGRPVEGHGESRLGEIQIIDFEHGYAHHEHGMGGQGGGVLAQPIHQGGDVAAEGEGLGDIEAFPSGLRFHHGGDHLELGAGVPAHQDGDAALAVEAAKEQFGVGEPGKGGAHLVSQ